MDNAEKHAPCIQVGLGRCICGTCKNDHEKIGETPPCCIKYYGISRCPVIKCPHYEKEEETS